MNNSNGGTAGFLARLTALVLIAALPGLPVSAQSGIQAGDTAREEAAKRYGSRSSVIDISLSPSGSKLAWISPGPGHTEQLNVLDLEGDGAVRTIAGNSEINLDLSQCDWATDNRLVCAIYGITETNEGVLLGFDRMFSLNADGSEATQLNENRSVFRTRFNQDGGDIVALDVAGEEGQILLTRDWVGDAAQLSRLGSRKEGLGVERLDIRSGRRRIEEQPDPKASFYLADATGVVRLKAIDSTDQRGLLTGKREYLVRRTADTPWKTLGEVMLDGKPLESYSPVAVDAGRNSIFAYTSLGGYRALIEIPIDGETPAAKVLASRGDVDVDGLIRIGRQRRVVGVSFATEKREVAYFDQSVAELASALGQALPNTPLIGIASANADESRLIIIASSDTDPGMVYLFDRNTNQLEVLLAMREALVEKPMGRMRPMVYPAADGTRIPGYLTLPPGSEGKGLPAIVLPHGGPAARDYWGFDWMVQFFTSRGYAVLQPNFRGSAGYGEAWFGRNGYQAWDVAIGDVNDAGRWMVEQGIADPDRLAIVGWSYGGYAALLSQVVDPDLFKAVVAIAPVTDLEFLREDARAYTNFRFRDRQLGQGPHIAAGSPLRHADKFRSPVALYHGTLDLNVNVRHSQEMAAALEKAGRQVTYVEFGDLEHSLDDSAARTRMLGSIDGFLEQSFAR
jgi:dipeptidyl aminopeptidase/acylaminoacyl peptidase